MNPPLAVPLVSAARRRFLSQGGALAGAAAGLAWPSQAAWARTDPDAGLEASALEAWKAAFADVPEQYGPVDIAWTRRLPDELAGTLYRNGPARMHRGATNYRHWFDGDGMVHAFRLSPTRLRHQAKMVRTAKYVAEEKAGRFLYSGFGTRIDDGPPGGGPDAGNVANISVLSVPGQSGPELLALWEAGSAYRIDPDKLDTLGRKVWSAESDGAAFSAHPKVDRDGTIWSFGYLPGSGRLLLYRIGASGKLQALQMVESADANMIHDFAITDRWLVFVLMPLGFDRDGQRGDGSFMSRLVWEGEQRGGTVMLVDKHSLAVAHRIEIPATPFFHLGNAWDDGDAVRIQVMAVAGYDAVMEGVLAAMAGRPRVLAETAPIEITVTPNQGRAQLRRLVDGAADFPSYDPRYIAQRTRALFSCTNTDSLPPGAFGFSAVRRLDTDSGRTQTFDYGPGFLVEEHLFIPRRRSTTEASGWLVGTARDYLRERTIVSVFDAQAVDAGPISQAYLPYGLPMGLHGHFVAA